MTFVSDSFLGLARARCRGLGMPDLRFVIVPHPMADRSPDEIEDIANQRFESVVAALTGTDAD